MPTLIESELFGHVKGRLHRRQPRQGRPARLGRRRHGFLDEIGELPLDLQARLLRALQEKDVRPVGSTHSVPIHARVLAATNRDFAVLVEQGRFRKDLFYRLNVVNLRIPPLRERRSDIPLLAAHFLDRLARESGVDYSLSDEALRMMVEYSWPGNVRELEHAIQRGATVSSGAAPAARRSLSQLVDSPCSGGPSTPPPRLGSEWPNGSMGTAMAARRQWLRPCPRRQDHPARGPGEAGHSSTSTPSRATN